jgi:hypothetical protein
LENVLKYENIDNIYITREELGFSYKKSCLHDTDEMI